VSDIVLLLMRKLWWFRLVGDCSLVMTSFLLMGVTG